MAIRTNLLPNPSFEVDAIGWTSAGRQTGTPAFVVSGSYYCTVSSASISSKLPATAGLPYTVSSYFTRATSARSVAIGLAFYDAANVELEPVALTQTALVAANVSERRSQTRTAPAGATQMAVIVSTSSITNMDAVLLEQSSTLGDYFDGSTVKAGFTYAWTGTAHASSSTETPAGGGPVTIDSAFSGAGTLSTGLAYTKNISSAFSGSGTLATALTNYQRIASAFSGSGSLIRKGIA